MGQNWINPYDIGYSNTKNGLRFVVPQVLNFNPEIILVPVAPHLYGEPTVHQPPTSRGNCELKNAASAPPSPGHRARKHLRPKMPIDSSP